MAVSRPFRRRLARRAGGLSARWLVAPLALAAGLPLGGCGLAATTPADHSASQATDFPRTAVSATTVAVRQPMPHRRHDVAHRASPARDHPPRSPRPHRERPPLAGRLIGIDPGHNGRNYTDPTYINHLIWNGREMETCNTTGTETDSGYPEAEFNFAVAVDLASVLRAQGARVVMTRHDNTGVGPCVNTRAEIIDRSHADVAVDIHADGGPPQGRGVAILEPVADGPNDDIISASEQFGQDVLNEMKSVTGMPASTYDGIGGVVQRDDLAGLNLTRVPEVLIESGNMRNATDAAMLTSPEFQRLEALALDRAIRRFLRPRV